MSKSASVSGYSPKTFAVLQKTGFDWQNTLLSWHGLLLVAEL
jgi:hypothetical protein